MSDDIGKQCKGLSSLSENDKLPKSISKISMLPSFDNLQTGQNRYNHLLNNISDGVYIDKDEVVVYANDAAAKIWGVKGANDLIGKSIFELFHSDFHESIISRRKHIVKTKKELPTAMETIIRGDGVSVPTEISAIQFTENGEDLIQVTVRRIECNNAEKKLIENPFKQLMNILPDTLIVCSDYKLVFINKSGVKFLGAKDESELLGKSIFDFFEKNACERVRNRIDNILNTGNSLSEIRSKIINLEGTAVDVEMSATPYDRNGKAAIQFLVSDITDRIKADKLIISSENKYRSLTENIKDAAWIIDPDTLKYIYCSPVMSTMLGYSMEELHSNILIAVKKEDDKKYLKDTVKDSVNKYLGGDTNVKFFRLNVQHVSKDGRTLFIDISANIYKNALSGKLEIHGISQDITDKVQANKILVASESKYRLLAENLKDVIWIINPIAYKFLYVSSSVSNVLGYTVEEFMNINIDGIYASADEAKKIRSKFLFSKKQIESEIKKFGEKHIDFDCVYRHKNGSNVYAEVRVCYLINPLTNELEFHGFSRDVSSQMKYEKEMLAAKEKAEASEKEMQLKNEEYESINEEMRQTNDELFQIQDRLRYKNKEYEVINKELVNINSELFEAKKRLEYNEALLIEAQSIAKTGNWTQDYKTDVLYWSDEMYNILDCKIEDFDGLDRNLFSFIHPDDLNMVQIAYQNHLNLKLPLNIVHRIKTRKGIIKFVQHKCKTEFDKTGNPLRSFSTITDITEQKNAENEIIESEAKYRLLTETMKDVVWIVDESTFTYSYISPAVYYLLGFTVDELSKLSFSHVFKDMQAANSIIEMHRSVAKRLLKGNVGENEFTQYDTVYRHKNGNIVYVEITAKHYVNKNTGKVEIHGVTHDITERVLAKMELEVAKENLEASQNDLQLKNEEYESVNEELRQTNEELFATQENLQNKNDEYEALNEELRLTNDELLQAKEEAEMSEASLREAQSIAKTGSYIYDFRTGKLSCSDEFCRIYEKDRETIESNNDFLLNQFHPDEKDLILDKIKEHLSEQTAFDNICRLNLESGKEKFISSKIITTFDNVGNPIKSKGIITDITERVQMERLKEISEHRFRLLAENTKDLAWVINLSTGNYEYLSPVVTDMLGYSVDEVMNSELELIFYDKKVAQNVRLEYRNKNKKFLKGEQVHGDFYSYEAVYQHKNGSLVNVEVSSHFYYNPDTNAFEVHGLTRDITQKCHDLKLIKESERQYVSLVDSLHGVVYRCKYNGKLTMIFLNNEIEKLTGYSKNDFLGNNGFTWGSIILSKDDSKIWKSEFNFNETGSSYVDEYRIKTKTGETKWVHEEGHVLYDENSKEFFIEGFINDITKLKDTAKREMNALITGEENERMRLARDLHDGLGPLMTTLRLFMEAMGKSSDAKVISEIARKSEKIYYEAVRTLTEISNNLSPHVLFNYGVYDAVKNFTEKVKLIYKMNFEINLIKNSRCESIIEITLYRTICELINNSIKHSGGDTIHMDFDIEEYYVSIFYSDNGHGFDVEKTLKSSVGMGLKNLQSRIKNVNGELYFDSVDGKGFSAKIIIGGIK